MNNENGVATLLDQQTNFDKDSVDLEYKAYTIFAQLKRTGDQSISDYLAEFETKYQNVETLGMKLPKPVQACKLLHGAGLSVIERQMVLAATHTATNWHRYCRDKI